MTKTQRTRKQIRKIENILFFLFKRRNWVKISDAFRYYARLKTTIKDANKPALLFKAFNYHCSLFQRPQHLANELSKLGYLVLYSEDKNEGIEFINNNLILLSCKLALFLTRKISKEVYIFVLSTSSYFSLNDVSKLKQKGYKIIYEYIDEMSEDIQDTSKAIELYNSLEMVKPELITTTSQKLYGEMIIRFSEDEVILNKNAVNLEDFNYEINNCPEDIKNILQKPVIGYYGAIAPWLDFDLINSMLVQKTQYNFVFIGADYDGTCIKRIKKADNFFWLGVKPYKELFSYSKYFSICIIPFKTGEIAKSTSPLKLFEYMAARKPVVCTKDLSECYGYEGVLISEDDKEFILNIDKALVLAENQTIKDKLYNYASKNTWEQRAKDIDEKLKKERIM